MLTAFKQLQTNLYLPRSFFGASAFSNSDLPTDLCLAPATAQPHGAPGRNPPSRRRAAASAAMFRAPGLNSVLNAASAARQILARRNAFEEAVTQSHRGERVFGDSRSADARFGCDGRGTLYLLK